MMVGMTESDGMALSMLVVMLMSFGFILTLLVCMGRSAARRDRDVDDLLDEMEEEGKRAKPVRGKETKEAWEKEGDWWRSGD